MESIEKYSCQGGDLGNQDILNMLFRHTWLPLHRKYNYQFGNYYYLKQLNHFKLYSEIIDIEKSGQSALLYRLTARWCVIPRGLDYSCWNNFRCIPEINMSIDNRGNNIRANNKVTEIFVGLTFRCPACN
ncbi:glycosyl transferase family protein [Actinobacillus lignieresii]|uniref:Glycosyl transferase family protein n=1 Tax=Actinobacillus lignieresii TaxID=720 RepID=A0A380U5A8_ACTLI|nr:glycosyl transferase family protein [Actinobacillus lignieresii]